MKTLLCAAALALVASSAHAELPIFAAKCPTGLTVDTNTNGQVYINGTVAKTINRPDGQITAQHAGVYIDITPQGDQPPFVTYTAKNKANGVCEVISFKAPDQGGEPDNASQSQSASERAGLGQFDARGQIPCAQTAGQPMGQCNFSVARDPGGTATVIVTLPDGRTRALFFDNGQATSADLSQADGDMSFQAEKRNDLYLISAGKERYEIPEVVIYGD